eukprot:693571-Rhodomonas_salina.1
MRRLGAGARGRGAGLFEHVMADAPLSSSKVPDPQRLPVARLPARRALRLAAAVCEGAAAKF